MFSNDAEDQDGPQPRGNAPSALEKCKWVAGQTALSTRKDMDQVGAWRPSSVVSIIADLSGNDYISSASLPPHQPVSATGGVTAKTAFWGSRTACSRAGQRRLRGRSKSQLCWAQQTGKGRSPAFAEGKLMSTNRLASWCFSQLPLAYLTSHLRKKKVHTGTKLLRRLPSCDTDCKCLRMRTRPFYRLVQQLP